MKQPIFRTNAFDRKRLIGEIVVSLAMLILAFFAIASSDASTAGTQLYWNVLVLVYAGVAIISDRIHSEHRINSLKSVARTLSHWAGILVAIQMVFYFADAGRVNNAAIGLFNALILALGTYLFGVFANWRFIVIGTALAAATGGVALVEEYLWFLTAVVVLVAIALVVGTHFLHRHRTSDKVANR